ncbi:uncharacterized protein BN781_00769 [Coprococcus sp. CAG:782]|jgi:hypothetical protein|nr:DUF4358 domain-containing protein [Coprococcus sp.]CCY54247.1 uncharacterized protein BN781_00769 [Coprococcus sp. CAG:782]
MKKKLLVCLAMAMCLAGFAGCGSKEEKKTEDVSMDIHSVAKEIVDNGNFTDIAEINKDKGISQYSVGDAEIADAVTYFSSGATAEEVVIFEGATDADADKLLTAAEERKEDDYKTWQDYKPEEVSRVDKAVIKKSGKYVVFCIADDKDAVSAVIDKYFK